jgi:indole-3-glycerol phosphate synthase
MAIGEGCSKPSLSEAIRGANREGRIALIADIKPQSPRDGALVGNRDPARLAEQLAEAGVCALSVVTETKHFGGSIDMLREVCRAVPLPVLRKDFLSTQQDIEISKEAGADAVLLILAATPAPVARSLNDHATMLDMESVIEVHTKAQLEQAIELTPTIIGINNRDILNLERDSGNVSVTERLAPLVPDSILIISESSLRTSDEIGRAISAGADAVLVGTALLQSPNPVSYAQTLMGQKGRTR